MLKFFKKLFLLFLIFCFTYFPSQAQARDPKLIYDWYIKDFESTIVVNKDSSLLITEKIVADCGNLPYKHGIFRTVPIQVRTPDYSIDTPVKLVSITDFQGNPYNHTTTTSYTDHTITWKIGDADIEVTGENDYLIIYKVENAIRFADDRFDDFYWNLNGNFWQLETDHFLGTIEFPDEVTKDNTQIDYYTGYFGEQYKNLANYQWVGPNTLQFESTDTLLDGQGISVSVVFPKNIFIEYKPPWWKTYGGYFWYLLPILIFWLAHMAWKKYGEDPKFNKTVIAFYEPPANLTPIETGLVMGNGRWKNDYISAGLINLGVKGYLKIEELKEKTLWSAADYKFTDLSEGKSQSDLNNTEKKLLEKFFGGKKEKKLSDLRYKFYQHIPAIQNSAKDRLKSKELITDSGKALQILFIVLAVFMIVPSLSFMFIFPNFGTSLFLTALILIIFGIIMTKRTEKGVELLWQVKGFKLFMETAEKYRQEFFEKESVRTGVFEKYLPYAMVFGITELWVKKMKEIYGEKFFDNYSPSWYTGQSLTMFNAAALTSALTSVQTNISHVSSSISSSTGSSSGFSGGGFSGGGGGGGGGGGW